MMNNRKRSVLLWTALVGMAFVGTGCESIREAAGVTKEPPDEFAVVTKSPLVIPPDFNLRPPKPGAAPTNQVSPTESAEAALYGDDPAQVAASIQGNYSDEEKILLANAGAANADHDVRKKIASDDRTMEDVNESFTDQILFGAPQPDQGKAVDADSEAQRIGDAKARGQQTVGSAASPPAASTGSSDQQPAPKKPDDSATIQKDGGGWFDWLF
jgi:hypothetical protein